MTTLDEFKTQWNIPADQFDQAWLDRTVSLATQLIDEMGDLGRKFNAAVANLDISEIIDPDPEVKRSAGLQIFVFGKGYSPLMMYTPSSLSDPYSFISARFHEYIHALQMENSPVLHASPSNAVGQVVLLPTAYVKVNELMEIDAYAKQAWLSHEFNKVHGLLTEDLANHPVGSVELFYVDAVARQEDNSLWEDLATTGLNIMQRYLIHWRNEDEAKPFLQAYHSAAIHHYVDAIGAWSQRHADRQAPEGFHLDAQTMLSIGNSFGPNIFEEPTSKGMLATFGSFDSISEGKKRDAAKLAWMFGIDDEAALELGTFTEELEKIDETPESFLIGSKKGVSGLSGGGGVQVTLKTDKPFTP